MGWGPHVIRVAFVREAVVRFARDGWIGRLAREVGLEDTLRDVYDDPDGVLLRLFRACHAASVYTASPLGLELLASSGLSPADLALDLTFDADWPPWLCGRRPSRARRFAYRWKGRAPPPPSEADDRRAFLNGGLVLRQRGASHGPLGIRLSAASLEVGGRLGSANLRTLAGTAWLTTRARVPETIKAAMVGRTVDEVFDHPLLRGRGYLVTEQRDLGPTGGAAAGWRLTLRVPEVRWQVPWSSAGLLYD